MKPYKITLILLSISLMLIGITKDLPLRESHVYILGAYIILFVVTLLKKERMRYEYLGRTNTNPFAG